MNIQTLLSQEEIELFNSLEQEAGGDKNKAKQLFCIHQINNLLEQEYPEPYEHSYREQIKNRLEMIRFLITRE